MAGDKSCFCLQQKNTQMERTHLDIYDNGAVFRQSDT